VSHETIYRTLFVQTRGALRKELMEHLRTKRKIRLSRHGSPHWLWTRQIVDAVSIRERAADIEDRAVPGHWKDWWSAAIEPVLRRSLSGPLASDVDQGEQETETVVPLSSRHTQASSSATQVVTGQGTGVGQHKNWRSRLTAKSTSLIRTRPGNAFQREHQRCATPYSQRHAWLCYD